MQPNLPRGAGILLPVSSLPSPYGIGTLGKAAHAFVDYLKLAGQRYWQVLPVGPTSFGDSPYQSFSAFAGNPYFIDLDLLCDDGLLLPAELPKSMEPAGKVAYDELYITRFPLLRKAYVRFVKDDGYERFCTRHKDWLEDYALFMAVKGAFGGREWLQWDADIRFRQKQALEDYRRRFADDVGFWKFCQYMFFKQWHDLKKYAGKRGIYIIGDMPLYVALDSADVWANRDDFELDEQGHPVRVAGVPPDLFSQTGQRWGNPLYNWKRMEASDFRWWRRRIKQSALLFDILRIDHFIGIARYYAIPASCETAVEGHWVKGPGAKLTDAVNKAAGGKIWILAEDLGVLHPSVKRLLDKNGYPGMKILLFAFDGSGDNSYLPHHYEKNAVVYGGTHDNETITGYCRGKSRESLAFMMAYLGVEKTEEIPTAMIRLGYGSVADVAVFQAQDLLGLDNDARMNEPSTIGHNWIWRLLPGQLDESLAAQLKKWAVLYGRCSE